MGLRSCSVKEPQLYHWKWSDSSEWTHCVDFGISLDRFSTEAKNNKCVMHIFYPEFFSIKYTRVWNWKAVGKMETIKETIIHAQSKRYTSVFYRICWILMRRSSYPKMLTRLEYRVCVCVRVFTILSIVCCSIRLFVSGNILTYAYKNAKRESRKSAKRERMRGSHFSSVLRPRYALLSINFWRLLFIFSVTFVILRSFPCWLGMLKLNILLFCV